MPGFGMLRVGIEDLPVDLRGLWQATRPVACDRMLKQFDGSRHEGLTRQRLTSGILSRANRRHKLLMILITSLRISFEPTGRCCR